MPPLAADATPLLVALIRELPHADPTHVRALADLLEPHLRPKPEQYLTTEEKAAQLRRNPEVLARWAREGRVPGAELVAGGWLFPADGRAVLPRAPASPAAPAPPRRARPEPERPSIAAIRGT
jgi:hypothetical protein